MFVPLVTERRCQRNETCAFWYGARLDPANDALPIDVVKIAVVRLGPVRGIEVTSCLGMCSGWSCGCLNDLWRRVYCESFKCSACCGG